MYPNKSHTTWYFSKISTVILPVVFSLVLSMILSMTHPGIFCPENKKIKNITKEIIEKFDWNFDSSTSKMFKHPDMINYVKYIITSTSPPSWVCYSLSRQMMLLIRIFKTVDKKHFHPSGPWLDWLHLLKVHWNDDWKLVWRLETGLCQ